MASIKEEIVKLPGRIKNVEIIEQRQVSPQNSTAYLSLHSLQVQNTYSDETKSAVYRYEGVLRKYLDAVVLVLTATVGRETQVCLRTSIRPPLLLRRTLALPQPDDDLPFALLELPAGLIEDTDKGPNGLRARAAAETIEETGYRVSPEDFSLLGSAPFVSAGVIPEKMIFMRAAVLNVNDRVPPEGDGSPAEEGADIVWVGVDWALKMCDNGAIVDMKTELGIRRLAALLASTGL
jgi:ADP-ribose pyrophosphatase